ncbi:NrsF family protein [Shinella zoogloeoides]|uniref:NrsF family protein n=1 Tax=Shinella zoogloeoides TaxID=352475 RepID=UPI0028A959B8|nr:NrsF family protein [Shinella zoogloeoides]
MKTDDLITLMAQDAPVGLRYGRALAVALGAGIVLSALLLVATVGLRHNMGSVFETARVLFKITVTLVLAVLAARLALRIGRPGEETRRPALLLAVPALMVAVAVVAELVTLPAGAWGASLVGRNALFCLFFVPVLSLAPLAGLFWALKKGAPANPARAGAAAGLAAGAVAAAIYAWHCPDDSPLFLATWYTVAIAAVTAAGAFLGRRLLRW